jgi:hypothetical protein
MGEAPSMPIEHRVYPHTPKRVPTKKSASLCSWWGWMPQRWSNPKSISSFPKSRQQVLNLNVDKAYIYIVTELGMGERRQIILLTPTKYESLKLIFYLKANKRIICTWTPRPNFVVFHVISIIALNHYQQERMAYKL